MDKVKFKSVKAYILAKKVRDHAKKEMASSYSEEAVKQFLDANAVCLNLEEALQELGWKP